MLRIKELRKISGESQVSIAKKLNVSRQVYANYENEINEPPFETLCKLASIFDCSVDYLLGRVDDYGNVTEEERASGLSEQKKISITPLEGELLMLFRELGYKHGESVQASILTVIENMLNLK
ncbi:MAG: helix-turn-helix transcriptional regulator [Clostridia bacterium]|nr:helix-turn-helix transcriptional regulator [Clostridia bacterium]